MGKDTKRRVFGFQCSPQIQSSLKSLSDQIHVPLFALTEHALQLAAMQLEEVNNNPEEREKLRRHITENHVEMNTIEKVARYDADAAEVLKLERIRRFKIDKAVRKIVVNFIGRGIDVKDIPWLIDYGMRCMIAVARGEPIPTDLPPNN